METNCWTMAFLGSLLVGGSLGCNPSTSGSTAATDDEEAPVITLKTEPAGPIWDPAGLGEFSFTDRNGQKVTRDDLKGKPAVFGFIFTRCAGPCPIVSGAMKGLQEDLRDVDFRLVTLTVDPEYDTPEVLQRYANAYSADPQKWLFLNGDKQRTYEFIRDSFKVPVEETTGEDRKPGFEIIHSVNLMLVNAEGVVVAKFNATKDDEVVRLRRILQGKDPFPATKAGGA